MTGKRFRYILIPTLTLCVFTTLLAATAKFRYQHPNAANEYFAVSRNGAVIHHPASAQSRVAKAVTDATEHDFGMMDPLTMGTHSFLVRNLGAVPLKLQAGPTSCKCTLSDVSEEPIPPGGQSHVTVQWNTGRKNRFYAHEASVYTNDPNQKLLDFSIRGIVRAQVAVHPPEAVFERIEPGRSASRKLLVYSQIWDDFELVDIQSSLSGLSWKIEAADTETRADHEARSACWICLVTPDDLPEGSFSEWLQFRVVPTGGVTEAIEHQVAIVGKTLRRLAVYGPGIDAQGVVSFGKVTRTRRAEKRLLMKVRDKQTNLPVKSIETSPEFFEVRVIPGREADSNGLMYLEILIPPGAPLSDFLAAVPAKIHLAFDHPRISDLELTARLAVVE